MYDDAQPDTMNLATTMAGSRKALVTSASLLPRLTAAPSSMGAGTVFMGWWPDEGSGVQFASQHGVATVASDYSTNLSVYSGTSRAITVPAMPARPALQNKIGDLDDPRASWLTPAGSRTPRGPTAAPPTPAGRGQRSRCEGETAMDHPASPRRS